MMLSVFVITFIHMSNFIHYEVLVLGLLSSVLCFSSFCPKIEQGKYLEGGHKN
jgi:hypothetical protein